MDSFGNSDKNKKSGTQY